MAKYYQYAVNNDGCVVADVVAVGSVVVTLDVAVLSHCSHTWSVVSTQGLSFRKEIHHKIEKKVN